MVSEILLIKLWNSSGSASSRVIDGRRLRCLKRSRAALTAAHLCYHLGEGNGGATVSDDVCYWGDDVTLPAHIFGILGLKGIRAEVRFAGEPIKFTSDAAERKRAAQEAWVAVAELGQAAGGIETVHHF